MPVKDCQLGFDTKILHMDLVYISEAKIGKNCIIAPFVVIRPGAKIGDDVDIQEYVFISENTVIGDNVVIEPGVKFAASRYSFNDELKTHSIIICDNVVLGTNCVILPGVTIGKGSRISPGSVVVKDVAPGMVACTVSKKWEKPLTNRK